MATIHVARDGAKLGEFSLEQIREGLATGQFRPTDLGWQAGMPDWRALSEFAAAPPSGAGEAPPTLPLSVPGVPSAAAGTGLPWEHRAQLGFVKSWFDTVSLLITKPGDAFTMMRAEGGLLDPLLFGLIGGCIGSIISLVFQGLFQSIPGMSAAHNPFDFFGWGPWALIIVYAVLMPFLLTLGLFLGGGVLHLCLMMVGGANRSFETTFRVACFTAGSANLFSMIPICGGLIAMVYHIVLQIIGVSRAHQTTTGKAALAVFLPLIVCCAVLILMGILLGGFGAFMSESFKRP